MTVPLASRLLARRRGKTRASAPSQAADPQVPQSIALA